MRQRVEEVERAAFRVGFMTESCQADITGAERWVEEHRAEIAADSEQRQEFAEELRRHRAIVHGYERELRELRLQIAKASDAVAGSEPMEADARVRAQYLRALTRERELAGGARARALPAEVSLFERVDALDARLAAVEPRANAAAEGFLDVAKRKSAGMRFALTEDRRAVEDARRALAALQEDAKEVVGRIAYQSFGQVKAQFYRLVLKADVGIVDVAWSRKRERMDKIQQLSMQKAAETQQLDQDYKGLLREAD
jgi:hypothetical protein